MLGCPEGCLGARADAEFGEDVAQMRLDRAHAENQRLGDIFVRKSPGEVTQHLRFAFGQGRDYLRFNWLLLCQRYQALDGYFRGQDDFPPSGSYDGPRQVPYRGVAGDEASGPSPQKRQDNGKFIGLNQEQQAAVRREPLKLPHVFGLGDRQVDQDSAFLLMLDMGQDVRWLGNRS